MASANASPAVELEVGHRTVRITNPERIYFPARGETKIDLAQPPRVALWCPVCRLLMPDVSSSDARC